MTKAPAFSKNPLDPQSWITLAVAFTLLLLVGGRFVVPAAAWLGPLFMVRFLRGQTPKKGLLFAYAVLVATIFIGWQGMIPIPFVSVHIIVVLIIAIVMSLPYAIDRYLSPHATGILGTLILPVAWVSVDYLNNLFNPYGDWGMIAYSQHGNLPLLQLLSVTGIWGVTFVVIWFSSIVNWAWEQNFEWAKIKPVVGLYSSVLAAVLLFGGLRVALFPIDANTVTVASVSAPVERGSISYTEDIDEDALRINKEKIIDELFRLSEIGVASGAKFVLWPEANAQVTKAEEDALIKRGSGFAKRHGVYLSMGLFTKIPGQYLRENKAVTLDPQGKVVAVYFKARPPIGEPTIIGDGIIPVIESPYGKFSSVICSDMDSPRHLRQQSVDAGIDIMLAPSWDWAEITPFHTYLSSFRAIENGFSMVRQTNDGLSMTTDYYGQVLASMNHYTTNEHVMISHVPTEGTTTIYALIGDVFAWACLLALFVGGLIVFRRGRSAS